MAEASADFETGVNGNPVLASDTGSATAWDDKAAFSGNTIVYDNTHTYDTLAGKFNNSGNSAASCVMQWTTGIGTLTDWYGRIYVYLTALPSTGNALRLLKDSAHSGQDIRILDTGQIQVIDADAVQVFVTTNSVNASGWTRIEFHCVQSATVGQWEVKLFTSPDSGTPVETQSSAANRNTAANLTGVYLGLNGGSDTATIWLDNIIVGATSWPGPAGGPPAQVLLASADSVDGAWHDNTGGANLTGAIDESTASDSDYILSELHPTTSSSRIKLASGIDPASSSGHVIHWRVRKDAAAGDTVDMTVTLRQGGGNSLGGGTQIATFTRTNVDGTGWTTYDETLSGGEADSITNYSDLYLEFTADT